MCSLYFHFARSRGPEVNHEAFPWTLKSRPALPDPYITHCLNHLLEHSDLPAMVAQDLSGSRQPNV